MDIYLSKYEPSNQTQADHVAGELYQIKNILKILRGDEK
jgi:hypothetical protein